MGSIDRRLFSQPRHACRAPSAVRLEPEEALTLTAPANVRSALPCRFSPDVAELFENSSNMANIQAVTPPPDDSKNQRR